MKINIHKDNKVSEAQNRNFTTKQEKLPYLIFDVRPYSSIRTIKKNWGTKKKKKQLQFQDTFSALFTIQDHSSMQISQIHKGKKKKKKQLLLLDTSIFMGYLQNFYLQCAFK